MTAHDSNIQCLQYSNIQCLTADVQLAPSVPAGTAAGQLLSELGMTCMHSHYDYACMHNAHSTQQ